MSRRRNQRRRNDRRRDRAQPTNRVGDPRVAYVDGYPVGPVGRFGRPWRRMENYVAHGEYLERELARASDPLEREVVTRALLAQIKKVERLARSLKRKV